MCVKRVFDLLLALAAAVVLALPVMLVAVLVRLTSPGPAFVLVRPRGALQRYFQNTQVSQHAGRPPAVATHLLADPTEHLTPIGRFLRKSSPDELPIPDKVKIDAEYLQRQSLWFDIRILWLTFGKVLRRDGITH